ncbi:MAG TPA: outer membrane beta-barrel family protein, partial [Bacteroidales bacterium]|nr:outer membrane beta-barrel family protein [Bacteroidales bacterium]
VKGGFDYEIDDKNTFSLSTTIGNYGFGIDMNSEINTFTDPVTVDEFLFSESLFERSGDYIQTTANYDLQFNDNGHRLQAMAYYSTGKDDELNTQKDFITDETFNVLNTGVIDEGIENTETEDEDQVRFKVDYTLPFENDSKLEAGVQTRLRYEESEYEFSFYEPESGDWIEDPDFYNRFNFDRNITSAYTTYSGSIGMFGVQAGLRGEYTDRVIANITGDSYEINRWDFFPSLHTSLEFDKNHKLMASYSKRIRRPRGWYLDPVISYRDRYTLRQGNPELEPEYTNSYELSFMKRFKSGFATIEAFYNRTKNEITRFNQIYEGNIMLMTFENVNEEDRMGMELMVNSEVFKWWNLNMSGSAYRFSVSDLQNGEEITRESNNWSARMNNDFIFSKNSRMQLTGFYRGPSTTIQGERGSFFYTSAAYRHDFMNKKLNMTVSIQDIFGTMGRDMITDQPSYYVKQDFNRQARVVRLSLSYKINDYKKKRGDRGSGGGDMEMEGEGEF